MYWQNGLVASQSDQVVLVQWVPELLRLVIYVRDRATTHEATDSLGSSSSSSANEASGSSAAVPSGWTSHSLLRQVIELVDALLDCYYASLSSTVVQWIPCTHCLRSRATYNKPFLFSVQECAESLASANPLLYCNRLCLPSRRVRLDDLAPDIAFTDLPELDVNCIEYQSVLFENSRVKIYRALMRGSLVAVKEPKKRDLADARQFLVLQREAFIMR
jgi:hypothetical protein